MTTKNKSKSIKLITPLQVLERAERLFLKKDLNGFADMFAVDGVHELPFAPPGVPKYLKGRENIRKYLTSITSTPLNHTNFMDQKIYETNDPEVVITEYTMCGFVESTKKKYKIQYIQVLRARDGEIVSWRDYWSPLAGIQVLGLGGVISHYFNIMMGKLRMNKKQIIAIILGTIISLLGLLWFLQGSDLVYIKPILCFANCEPITGKSATWQITGGVSFFIGLSLIYINLKRHNSQKWE